jgi:putative SOS response-associated peptidase YedK
MPAILRNQDYERWLSAEPDPQDVLQPFPADPMRMWPISARVNSPLDDERLLDRGTGLRVPASLRNGGGTAT